MIESNYDESENIIIKCSKNKRSRLIHDDKVYYNNKTNTELENLNKIINEQYSENIANELSDSSLMELYLNSNSTVEKNNKVSNYIEQLLYNYKNMNPSEFTNYKKQTITNLTTLMIEPGTKGAIRGNKFNKLVKEKISTIKEKYANIIDISFETYLKNDDSKERPDFVIYNKINNKYIIGMNQVDLWNGGQQLNRASNYLDNSKNNDNKKFLCVIANKYECKNTKSKSFKLIKYGFDNERICYIDHIENVMLKFFNM